MRGSACGCDVSGRCESLLSDVFLVRSDSSVCPLSRCHMLLLGNLYADIVSIRANSILFSGLGVIRRAGREVGTSDASTALRKDASYYCFSRKSRQLGMRDLASKGIRKRYGDPSRGSGIKWGHPSRTSLGDLYATTASRGNLSELGVGGLKSRRMWNPPGNCDLGGTVGRTGNGQRTLGICGFANAFVQNPRPVSLRSRRASSARMPHTTSNAAQGGTGTPASRFLLLQRRCYNTDLLE
ncbi:hypothetical protein VUR80DRAFT_9723 [Thermomyces stellatus]